MKRSRLKRKTPLRAKASPRVNLKALLTSSAEKKLARASRQAILANLAEEIALPAEGPKTLPAAERGLELSRKKRKGLVPRSKTNRKRSRNIPYMLWVKTLPCAVCGRNNSEAAHTGRRGLGQKAPDEQTIPLCPRHHRDYKDALDVAGPVRFQQIHGIDIKALVGRLQGAWALVQANPPVTAFNPTIDETKEVGYV